MASTVFFAWQLDVPAEQNKKFIWEAITSACDRIVDATPELAPRPELDTQGVPGSPNIVQTIFNRISKCAVFVADLSFVATVESKNKKAPNPNVLIELGFAAKSVGWERTILVLNDKFGEGDDLPFDIKQHRWPIRYRLSEYTKVGEKRFKQLSDALADAIVECEKHSLNRAVEMAELLDSSSLNFIATHENSESIPMPMPQRNLGNRVAFLEDILAARRLLELGALRIANPPGFGYSWTYDGIRMISEFKRRHPSILELLRKNIEESRKS